MRIQPVHIRWAVFGLAILLSLPLFPAPFSGIYLWASPFILFNSVLSGSGLAWVQLFGLAFLVTAVFKKRWICRYACPAGVLCDLSSKGGIRKTIRMKFPLGKYLAIAALVMAALGAPVLMVTDPFNLFYMGFEGFRTGFGLHALLKLSGVIFLIIFSLFLPNVWCSSVCPLGGLQLLVSDIRRSVTRLLRPGIQSGQTGMDRRIFLAGFSGLLGGIVVPRLFRGRKSGWIRPPFSIPEDRLNMTCIRCGNCTSVCPTGILHPSTDVTQPESLLTPVVRYLDSYCITECNECGNACPSGAIRRFTPAEKKDYVMGIAMIRLEDCYLRNGKECNLCRQYCNYEAIRMIPPDEGFTPAPSVVEENCVGCGACQVVCPPQVIDIMVPA